MSNLDTNYVVNLDLVKDRVNSVMKFGLADVETSDFYLGLCNNGTRVFDKDYTVMLYIVKPNGNFRNIELEPKVSLKKYYCNLPDTLKNIPGEYLCQAVIFNNLTSEKKISKSKFKYSVDLDLASEMAGIIDEEEQENILTDILNRLLTLENPVEPYATQKYVNECVSTLTEEVDTIKEKDVEQNERLVNIESKNTEQDNRLNIIETKDIEHESRMANIESKNIEQDNRLTSIEGINATQDNRLDELESKDIIHESRMTDIETKNTEQDNRLDIAENRLANIGNDITNTMQPIIDEHTSRLDAIEAIDVAQNSRLDAIEAKNTEQDDRLLDIEKANKRQDMDLKCLFTEAKNNMIDITEEGNNINLQNSTEGHVFIDELKGNTLVNCNKEPDKELILNGNINTQGYSNVTLTEGVDGGLVDVALEGNTLVNVSKTKDITALPLSEELTYLYANTQYTVQFISDTAITADITLGGTQLLAQSIIKGLNRISITTPETLVDNKLIINGVGANISEVVVTDTDREFGYFEGMKSVGECENNTLEIICKNNDNSKSNTQTLTHEPLRAVEDIKDKYVLIDGKWYIERNCGELVLDGSNDEKWEQFVINANNKQPNTAFAEIIIDCNSTYGVCDSRKIIKDDLWGVEKYNSMEVIALHVMRDNLGKVQVLVPSTYLTTSDISGFRYYLNQKPIKIVYIKASTYEPIDYNPFTVYSDITHISNNSTIPCNMTIKNTGYNCLLKPSTTYTVSSNLGLNTVTTPSTLTEDCLRFMDTDTSDVTTMKNVTILEGDYTTGKPIPSHFSGIESAFEQEYDEAVGKYKVKIRVQNEDTSKENYIEFYIDEPLRGVGDVKDRVYVKDDKVVVQRNCGSEVFDGSYDENWLKYSNNTTQHNTTDRTSVFSVPITGKKIGYKTSCCDKFSNSNDGSAFIMSKCRPNICTDHPENNHIYFDYGNNNNYTTNDFRQWLQQNPTTVVYQLAESTYEEVEYNDVKLFIESFKNSTLFYNSNVPVTSKLYYSYSVPIVDTVAKTASISDEQDQLIIDLATQCAVMEMYLM